MSEDTKEKVCPFMYSGFFEPCIKEECMAWDVKDCKLIPSYGDAV
jgi:hypothetical protein